VDALAEGSEEGRGQLRKASGSCKQALIRGCPNGETQGSEPPLRPDEHIVGCERTQGSEPSQYLEEKKETSIPRVVASEIGGAQTFCTLPAVKPAGESEIEPDRQVTRANWLGGG
jgi:hypothetical protein